MRTVTTLASILALTLACAPTMAQSEGSPGTPAGDSGSGRLAAGSKAPALSVDEFIKGKPVAGLNEGTAYVVEFWATWCPPCISSIPHLSKLQKKHKNIVVIGVAGAERSGKEPLEAFVKKQGSKMAYTVAHDADRSMWNAWMTPAGQNGIPCAFLVDAKGNIAWIGNPHSEAFDAEVAKVAKGSKLAKAAKSGAKDSDGASDSGSDASKDSSSDSDQDSKQDSKQDSQKDSASDSNSSSDQGSSKGSTKGRSSGGSGSTKGGSSGSTP